MTQLQVNRFKQAEYEFTRYRVVPEHNTPFDAVLDPSYWAHVSAKLRPSDEIIVEAEDGSYWAQLLVRDAGRLYAKVAVIQKVDFEKEEVTGELQIKHDLSVKWRGPHLKWCVLRGDDVLVEHKPSKSEASAWMGEHLKTMAR